MTTKNIRDAIESYKAPCAFVLLSLGSGRRDPRRSAGPVILRSKHPTFAWASEFVVWQDQVRPLVKFLCSVKE